MEKAERWDAENAGPEMQNRKMQDWKMKDQNSKRSKCHCILWSRISVLHFLVSTFWSFTFLSCTCGHLITLDLPCSSLAILPRDPMLARYMLSSCVRPSVSPSQAGTAQKRLNKGSRNNALRKLGYCRFLTPKSRRNSNGVTPYEGAK